MGSGSAALYGADAVSAARELARQAIRDARGRYAHDHHGEEPASTVRGCSSLPGRGRSVLDHRKCVPGLGRDSMQFDQLRRRDLISLLGGAVAWPLAARAQQPAMPVMGFINSQSPEGYTERLRGFRQGLKETGYVERENVMIEYRWAENQMDRLPELTADLVHRPAAMIVATNTAAAIAAKAATTTIPIAFMTAEDPVRLGLVASLARPAGNLTGINFFTGELAAKRLEMLRELVPAATRVAVLVNPTQAAPTESTLRSVEAAARAMGLQIQVLNASSSREIDAAFATFARERPDALFLGVDPFLNSRRAQLVNLAARYAIPATFSNRDFAEIGGLMSYGADIVDAFRQLGIYAGRILKGAKSADLPVVQRGNRCKKRPWNEAFREPCATDVQYRRGHRTSLRPGERTGALFLWQREAFWRRSRIRARARPRSSARTP